MRSDTIFCPSCSGAVPVIEPGAKQHCPYCGAEVWTPLTNQEVGDFSGRLMAAMSRRSGELSPLQTAMYQAAQAGDQEALRGAVRREAQITFEIYDETGAWPTYGCVTPEQIEAHKRQHIERQMQTYAQMSPTLSSAHTSRYADQAQALADAYNEAIARRDVDAIFRTYEAMTRNSFKILGGEYSQEETMQAVRLGVEQTLRDQEWVTPEDLKHFGFEVIYDAKLLEDGRIEVGCQGCGATMQAPKGTERLKCPYCEAVTRVALHGAQRDQVFTEAMHGAQSDAEAWRGYLEQMKGVAQQALPGEPPESALMRAATFYYFSQGYASMCSPQDINKARHELKLGPDVTCATCDTSAPSAPGLTICPLCRQPR